MAIKNINRDPKSSEFSKNEIVINSKDGGLFYKTNNNIVNKIPGSAFSIPSTKNIPIITLPQMIPIATDFLGSTEEKSIPIVDTLEQNKLKQSDCLLFPFGGKINSLFFKMTGKTSFITLRVYKNLTEKDNFFRKKPNLSEQQPNGILLKEKKIKPKYGKGDNIGWQIKEGMTIIPIDISLNPGDHSIITLQSSSDGRIDELFGTLSITFNTTL